MEGQPTVAISHGSHTRLSIAVAIAILAIAALLGLWIVHSTPEYAADARLAYSGGDSGLPAGVGAATALGWRVLDDAQLAAMMDRLDLYPELRQKESDAKVAAHLRSHLLLSEPEPDVLQVRFLGATPQQTTEVANGTADLLAAYATTQTEVRTIAAPGAPARRVSARPPVQAAPVLQAVPAGSRADVQALRVEASRIQEALVNLTKARDGMKADLRQTETRMASLEAAVSAPAPARVQADPNAAQRAQLEAQIAQDQTTLAGLLSRYTDAYPDVQEEREKIKSLNAALAALPQPVAKPSSRVSMTAAQETELTQLHAQHDRLEQDLAGMESTLASEQQKQSDVQASIQAAQIAVPVVPQPAPAPVAAAPAPAVSQTKQVTISTVVTPFRVTARAKSAVRLGTSKEAKWIWLGVGTLLLLMLCFVPMVPARYATVDGADDVKESVPEHVTYLGDVRRTDH